MSLTTPLLQGMLTDLVRNNVFILQGDGTPSSSTGASIAGPGSLYVDKINKTLYQNTGTIYTPSWTQFASTGSIIGLIPYVNVKDYGALGNGAADDGVAIQAAIDAARALGGGTVYFPAGRYLVPNRTISLKNFVNLLGEGPGSTIIQQTGAVQSLIIPEIGANYEINKLQLIAIGDCIDIGSLIQEKLRFSHLLLHPGTNGWGIRASDLGNPDSFYDTISMNGPIDGNGIMLSGATRLINFQAAGMKEALRVFGSGGNFIAGGRIEVCVTGVRFGIGSDGLPAQFGTASFQFSSYSFESCNYNIKIEGNGIDNARIGELVINGFNGAAPDGSGHTTGGNMVYGMYIQGARNSTFENIISTGQYPHGAAIRMAGGVYGNKFRNVHASTTGVTQGGGWSGIDNVLSGSNSEGNTFEGCPGIIQSFPLINDPIYKGVRTLSLAAYDLLGTPAIGKNLRGIAVPVTQTATSVAIAFASGQSSGGIDITSATAANTGGATLPAGTYYYKDSALTANGEIIGVTEFTVVVGGANNSVNLTMAGSASGYVYRIYRGTSPGVYDGYFQVAPGAATYTDNGSAFTAGGQPPVGGENGDNGSQEPDTNYAVNATPNWATTVYVTAKATSGFTINFGTAAPASAKVDWFIVR